VPALDTIIAFAGISAVLMMVPGPSSFFILAQGLRHGRRSAVAATAGIEIASAVRVLLAATGLSALVASSDAALGVITWLGVGYLTVLGIQAFRTAVTCSSADEPRPRLTLTQCARRGVLVGLVNPKMILFFVAFFPQFVDPSQGSAVTQILVLGAVFWTLGTVWDLGLAWATGTIGARLDSSSGSGTFRRRFEGLAYLGLAGWAAMSA
jgi:threonine/homoserine/homoserine lactone efflux protein